MSFGGDLYSWLTSTATQNAALYALTAAHVYHLGEMPKSPPGQYITWQRISGEHTHHQGGDAGLGMPRIQFNCVAHASKKANEILDALRDRLMGFRGTMGSTAVRAASVEDDGEQFTEPADQSTVGRFLAILDIRFAHVETVATPTA